MRAFTFVCAIVLVTACSSSTSVRPFGGTYDLITANGQAVPAPLFPGLPTVDVVGGTVSAGPDTLNILLSLQLVDNKGRTVGSVTPLRSALPYVRHGDSLLLAESDSINDGLGGLVPGSEPIGKILGSSVELTLFLGQPVSTGFSGPTTRFLFTPAH